MTNRYYVKPYEDKIEIVDNKTSDVVATFHDQDLANDSCAALNSKANENKYTYDEEGDVFLNGENVATFHDDEYAGLAAEYCQFKNGY